MTTESNALAFSAVFLVKNPPTDARVAELVEWGKKCRSLGVVQGAEGNLSFRTRLGFIITGTGTALDALTPETISEVTGVVYGLNKTSAYVKGLAVPSRETILHAQVYEERQDVNAIFHVHDAAVMARAEKLGIPVTAAEQPAGSLQMAEEAIRLLKSNREAYYFVLRNHGVVSLGGSMNEAGKLLQEMRGKVKGK